MHLVDLGLGHVLLGHLQRVEHACGVDGELAEDGEEERWVEDGGEGEGGGELVEGARKGEGDGGDGEEHCKHARDSKRVAPQWAGERQRHVTREGGREGVGARVGIPCTHCPRR